jgi:hypothetical protein
MANRHSSFYELTLCRATVVTDGYIWRTLGWLHTHERS